MISKLALVVFGGGFALVGSILFTHFNFPKFEKLAESAVVKESKSSPAAMPTNQASAKEIQNGIMPIPAVLPTLLQTPSSLPTVSAQKTPEVSKENINIQTPTPVQTNTIQPVAAPKASHIFYTSSHWKSKYYYCDTDDGWKKLSTNYLKSFNNEAELLKNYSRTLHQPCKD